MSRKKSPKHPAAYLRSLYGIVFFWLFSIHGGGLNLRLFRPLHRYAKQSVCIFDRRILA